jgi:Putative zincin peptidase
VAFSLVETVSRTSIGPWVQPHIFVWRTIPVLYWMLNLAAGILIWETWSGTALTAIDGFSMFSLGATVGFLVLLPVHEHVHAWAYRRQGAQRVEVRYLWKQMTALCVAPGEVLSGRAFAPVCLAPIVVINTVLLGTWLLLPDGALALAVAGALLMHTAAASGDIAFLQYVFSQGLDDVFTYDDADAPVTYFFRRAERCPRDLGTFGTSGPRDLRDFGTTPSARPRMSRRGFPSVRTGAPTRWETG